MASGFDELIGSLLYDVALSGGRGLGIQELGNAVREFYTSRNGGEAPEAEPLSEDDLLFSEEPPGQAGPVIDDKFIDLVFDWVSQNPEVTIKDAEEVGARVELIKSKRSKNDGGNAHGHHGESATSGSQYANKRLCTGEDRVWYAISGHGVDYKRIPPLEFEALCVIASHGAKGVLQPDVTAETGQDKRSLPKRTDNLAKNGYIEKTTVIARGTKTSLLKLKKFAGQGEKLEDSQAPKGTSIIEYNEWFEKAMDLLKKNDNVIAFEDLRGGLGIQKKRYETRALHRCVRRLAKAGCLRKVTARVALTDYDGDEPMWDKPVRSLQLLREPTDLDRIAFMRSDWRKSGHLVKLKAIEGAGARQPEDYATDEDDEDDLAADDNGDGDNDDEYVDITHLEKPRVAPVWTPDLPFANFLRDRIEEAGPEGICSADLYTSAVGYFWKRSTDEMLVKLTDLWQHSQPPHLRHLTIIRDTSQQGKQPVFQYRTYENFQKAVERGDAYWEGITGSDLSGKNKPSKKKLDEAAAAQPVLDDWGFPMLPPQLFVKGTGSATLDECRRAAIAKAGAKSGFPQISEPRHGLQLADKQVARTKPGTESARQYQTEYRQRRQIEKEKQDWAKAARKIAERRARAEFGSTSLKRTASEAGLDEAGGNKRAQYVKEGTNLGVGQTSHQQSNGTPSSSTSPADVDHNIIEHQTTTGGKSAAKPKKIGRPTKAMLKERERLQKQAEVMAAAGDTDQVEVAGDQSANGASEPDVTGSTDDPLLTARIGEIYSDLVNMSKPGVYIEPPGARLLKALVQKKGKGPRNTKIAVFKSERLKDFDWFQDEGHGVRLPSPAPPPTSSRKKVRTQRNYEEVQRTPAAHADEGVNAMPSEAPQDVDDDLPESVGGEREPLDFEPETDYMAAEQPQDDILDPVLRDASSAHDTKDNENVAEDAVMLDEDVTAGANPDTAPEPGDGVEEEDTLPEVTLQELHDPPPRTMFKKAGVHKNSGALHIKRTKIAMDIVESCGGMFPGRNEMWFPFRTIWDREFGQVPDKHTVENVIKALLNQGRLKKLTFAFQTKKGLTLQRSILAKPDVDPNSLAFRTMQKGIIDAYPATYIPEEAEVSLQLREHIARNTQIAHNAKIAKNNAPQKPSDNDDDTPKQLAPHYSRDEFVSDRTVVVKRITSKSGLGHAEQELRDYKARVEKKRLKTELRAQEAAAREERRRKKTTARDAEWDTSDDDEESAYEEQVALQNEMQVESYQHDPSAVFIREGRGRISSNFRLGRRDVIRHRPARLPGRVLRPRKVAPANNTADKAATGAVPVTSVLPEYPSASAHAHSPYVPAAPMTANEQTVSNEKPARRVTRRTPPESQEPYEPFQWIMEDGSTVEPEAVPRQMPSFKQAFARPIVTLSTNQVPSYGLIAPAGEQVHFARAQYKGADLEAAYVPQSLNEILAHDEQPSQPATNDLEHEAGNFFEEVDRVEKWELQALKNTNQVLVRGKDNPFINHTSPAVIAKPPPEPPLQQPKRILKRTRAEPDPEEAQQEPQPKRRYQSRRVTVEQSPSASPPPATHRRVRRDRQSAAAFTSKHYDRLTKAVALVWTVAGGLGGRINWYIVAHALSYRYDSEFLRHRWDKVRTARDPVVKMIQSQLWEPFLAAYEAGVLPTVDFEELEETDWPGLMDWVEAQTLTTNSNDPAPAVVKTLELPASETVLHSDFNILEADSAPMVARELFYSALTEKMRQNIANSNLAGHAVSSSVDLQQSSNDVDHLVRSWARATVLTPADRYDDKKAHDKISRFGSDELKKALEDLHDEKILQRKKKDRTVPGRNYDIRDIVIKEFRRWPGREAEHKYLRVVASKREKILQGLKKSDHYELNYTVTDEEALVLTNMVGQGMLRAVSKLPKRNDDFDAPWPKITKWGYTGYNYTARSVDRTRLRFDIVYEKTDNFTSEHDLKRNVPIPMHPKQVPGEPGLRLPLWVDIHGGLLNGWWEMVVRSILHLISFRPGIDTAEIVSGHSNKLWLWEAELAMTWMDEVGLAERIGKGCEEDGVWKGGWKAGEWWYCALCPGVMFPASSAVDEMVEEID